MNHEPHERHERVERWVETAALVIGAGLFTVMSAALEGWIGWKAAVLLVRGLLPLGVAAVLFLVFTSAARIWKEWNRAMEEKEILERRFREQVRWENHIKDMGKTEGAVIAELLKKAREK